MRITTIQDVIAEKKGFEEPWMQCPSDETDIPGLAFICPLEELIVAKKRDMLHDIIGKQGIAYTIFNSVGQKVFLAVLDKHFRHFNVKIFNIYGNEVINVKRPFALCTNRALVWAPPGHYVGSVKQIRSCKSTYKVKNCYGKKVLKIVADGMFQYVYKVYLWYGGGPIGVVKPQIPVADHLNVKNFGVSFPVELDIRDKAVLLGACFLIGCLKYNHT